MKKEIVMVTSPPSRESSKTPPPYRPKSPAFSVGSNGTVSSAKQYWDHMPNKMKATPPQVTDTEYMFSQTDTWNGQQRHLKAQSESTLPKASEETGAAPTYTQATSTSAEAETAMRKAKRGIKNWRRLETWFKNVGKVRG